MKAVFVLSIIAGMLLSFSCFAQTKTAAAKPAVADTAKPVFTVKFGPYADSAKLLATAAKQISKMELKVTDAKGVAYKIFAFTFAWKRKDVTDDLKTGAPKTVYLYSAVDVKADSHIPAGWQQELNNNLQPKEELRFEEIFVLHPVTKKLYKANGIGLQVM